ncbi:MAG: hypothetical protein IIV92_03420 [Schwartzia sp.]|nr:hypothetical protein [Schwartzia sp. (in: firmicutes)]
MNAVDIVLGAGVVGIFGFAVWKGFLKKGKCGACSCGCSAEAAKRCSSRH